jgi:tetratricopeptide (TPR) repeat protein
VLLWAGLIFAGALLVTGLTIWKKNAASKAAQSAAIDPRGRSIDPRAREEYLQARNYWKLRTAEALTKAIDHYNLAIELVPDYAEAYAGLANCYVVLPMLTTVSTEDTYPKARQAAEKAVALDDSLAQAHLAAAEIKLYSDWNFPCAEKEFRRAVELDANDAQAHQWYAEFLSLMGRHREAIAQIQTALHLDPSSMIIHHQAGQIFQAARMYPEALLEYQRALMIQPGFGPTYSTMALAYCRQGRYAECLDAARQDHLYWDPGGTATKDLERLPYRRQTGVSACLTRIRQEASAAPLLLRRSLCSGG